MSEGLLIAVIGVATLVLTIYDAVCMMKLRRRTGDRPALRQAFRMAFGGENTNPENARLIRTALVARFASFAGIVALMVLLAATWQ